MGCIALVRCVLVLRCGIRMQAEALVPQPAYGVLVLRCGLAVVVWYPYALVPQPAYGVLRCVGVTLWFGCGGVVSVCRLRHECLSLHTDTTPPQPNHNITPTHIEPQQYNP